MRESVNVIMRDIVNMVVWSVDLLECDGIVGNCECGYVKACEFDDVLECECGYVRMWEKDDVRECESCDIKTVNAFVWDIVNVVTWNVMNVVIWKSVNVKTQDIVNVVMWGSVNVAM